MWNFRHSKGLKKFKIKKPRTEIEPDEIFWDGIAQKKEESLDISSHKMETPISTRNIWLLSAIFLLFILGLFSRSVYLQAVRGGDLLAKSQKNRFLAQELKTERGVIYDRKGTQLVFNESNFDLLCDVQKFQKDNNEKEKTLRSLSEMLGKSWEEIDKEINSHSQDKEFILSKDLDLDKVIIFNARMEEFSGFRIEEAKSRNYSQSEMFASVLGYISDGGENGSGLEKYYNEYLQEKSGVAQTERTASGETLDSKLVKAPETGNSLVLSIDAGLQEQIYASLSTALKDYGATKAAAVAVNPQNGEILAMVSIPSFDNNVFSKDISHEEYQKIISNPNFSLYNRAISGAYPVGSTVKPLLAAAALEEGTITPTKTIDCQGGIPLKDGTFKSDWKTHGLTDLNKAIAQSCDVYFYSVGGGYGSQEGLGIDRIKKYFQLFGFGSATGIDLPGEDAGFIPDGTWKKEKYGQSWYPGDTYNISIGQGYLKVTPLQLAMATAAIANGGKLYSPRLVQKIVDDKNNTIKEIKPEIIRENFISSETLAVVREAMRQTVVMPGGTATSFSLLPVSSAAKSGTVETSKKEYYHNLMITFAPYDEPKIALVVILESVYQHLGIVNTPAREILKWYFTPEDVKLEQASQDQSAGQPAEAVSSTEAIMPGQQEEPEGSGGQIVNAGGQ
ncbi:MAG: penicillin-binding protein 2 [Candidatus Paceibacterota bacterium]|jgi:penicillin-binding protein 2